MSEPMIYDSRASATGTNAIGIKISGDATVHNTRARGAASDITLGTGATLYADNIDYTTSTLGSGAAIEPLAGDRATWDTATYFDRHASDIAADTFTYHNDPSNPALDATLLNTHIFVGNASNVATDVAMSNDATMANTGALTLKNTGPGATGPIGSATVAPIISIDAQGRVTALTSATISAGHTIQNEGTPLTKRDNLNFVGALVNATDDAGNNASVVTVNGALNDLTDVDTTGTTTGDIIYNDAGTWKDYPLGIGVRVTASGTKIRFGNVTGGNYLEIDSVTGTLRLVGDATTWDDFRVEASIVKAGATAPSYKAFGPSGNLQALMFEAGHHDEAMFEMQMPHNWKLGSNIYPHVHWTPTTADAGNVVWELEYAWCNIGDTFGAPSNMASDPTAAGGTAWVHKLTYLKSGGNNYIDATGKTLSSMLVCRIHRNSNSGSDTLNKDVALLEVDFHYQIDSLGSDEELVKDASASLLLETGDILLLETGDRLLRE